MNGPDLLCWWRPPGRRISASKKGAKKRPSLLQQGVPIMKALFLSFLSACSIQISTIACAAESDLDPAFGIGGRVVFDQWRQSSPTHAIVQQADGKLVLASSSYGDTNLLSIARMQTDGTLDPSFGNGGIVTGDVEFETALDVIEQQDKKLVVAGFDWQHSLALIWRFNANGDSDTTFGANGVVHVDIDGFDQAQKIFQQPDGKLIVAGIVTTTDARLLLARFTANGELDPSFGSGGTSTIDLVGDNDWAELAALVRQPDGRLILAALTRGQLVILRVMEDGSLDESFGSNGSSSIDATQIDPDHTSIVEGSVAIQADGKIVASATAYHCDIDPWGDCITFDDGFIVRLEPTGALDPTFGDGKVVVEDVGFTSIVVEADDRIVCSFIQDFTEVGLMRFGSDGSLDLDFGDNGRAIADFGYDDLTPVYHSQSMIRQTDGKHVVLTGFAIANSNIGWFAAIARFGAKAPGFAGLVGVSNGYTTEGYPATLEFRRTGGSSGAITVNFQTANGTAQAERDYVSQSGQVSWADGDISPRYIEFATLDDDEVEVQSFETFTVQLSDPTNGALLTNSFGSIDIDDDDPEVAPPPPPPADDSAMGGGGGAAGLLSVLLLGIVRLLQEFTRRSKRPEHAWRSLEA